MLATAIALLICTPAAAEGLDGLGGVREREIPEEQRQLLKDLFSLQIGDIVPVPSPSQAILIGHDGDRMLLLRSEVIPSMRRAQDSISIVYQTKFDAETARVISRDVSTRGPGGYLAFGGDGVIANGNGTNYGHYDETLFATWAKGETNLREVARYPVAPPVALKDGLLYVSKQREPGAFFYAPREGIDYAVDKAIKLADKDFRFNLKSRPSYQHVHANDQYLVVIDFALESARVLDLETKKVSEIKLGASKLNPFWEFTVFQLDGDRLLVIHQLFDLKTGKVVATIPEDPGKPPMRVAFMRDGVLYGWSHARSRRIPGEPEPADRFLLLACPALEPGKGTIQIAAVPRKKIQHAQWSAHPQLFQGEGGLVYSDGDQWVKTDWLTVADFDEQQAE